MILVGEDLLPSGWPKPLICKHLCPKFSKYLKSIILPTLLTIAFVDVAFQRKFTTINLTRKLATIFSFLTIFITGLGLFGLASFSAQQRIKEIGIRKVLGASISSLMALMSRDFSKLVIIAFVIASPVAWFMLNNYLDRYPMRVEISWWIFPLTGVIALLFALAIVSNQALRAAKTNPARSLRSE